MFNTYEKRNLVKFMRVHVTTTIDLQIKNEFEASQTIHRKTMSELLETAITELMTKINTEGAIDREISSLEEEINKKADKITELKKLSTKV